MAHMGSTRAHAKIAHHAIISIVTTFFAITASFFTFGFRLSNFFLRHWFSFFGHFFKFHESFRWTFSVSTTIFGKEDESLVFISNGFKDSFVDTFIIAFLHSSAGFIVL